MLCAVPQIDCPEAPILAAAEISFDFDENPKYYFSDDHLTDPSNAEP